MAQRKSARSLPIWVGDLPVRERILGNGLKVLVLPRASSSTVVCDLFYPAGAAVEPPGQSGVAHFVEHMLFKGTERFPKGQIDHLAMRSAGEANAETGDDDTHFWFAFPADRWELALMIEADRMVNAQFDPAEVEAERHVIAEERARDLDSPIGRLDQAHRAVSYLVHPYRNPLLGWPEDLRRLSAEDLRAFYQTHYRPDGAVLVIAGAVDPARALDRAEAHFGGVPRGSLVRPEPAGWEPPQRGRRDVRLAEPGDGVVRGLLGWRTVPSGHPDAPGLDVVADLLTGGRKSRLWSELVDHHRLVSLVDASHEPARLAGQTVVQIEAVPGAPHETIEACVLESIKRLGLTGPTDEELARVRARREAAWRWGQEDLAGLAAGLGGRALWRSWTDFQEQHRAAMVVDAGTVRDLVHQYLRDDHLTVGWSVPSPSASPPEAVELPRMPRRRHSPIVASEPAAVDWSPPRSASKLDAYQPKRLVLPNGLRLVWERRPGAGTLAMELRIEAGQLQEAKPGLAHLAGRLREEGAGPRSEIELAQTIESLGGTLDMGATGPGLRLRSEDLALGVEILADLMIRPRFPADAVEWIKRRMAGELQADRDEPSFRAEQAFQALIHGDHPYGRDPRGNTRQIAALTRDDVLAHHQAFCRPNNAILAVVGDFNAQELRRLVNRAFGDWRPGPVPIVPQPPLIRGTRPRTRRISAAGEQVQILMGHLGIRRNDPDFDAICVLDPILGSGPGFTDRLSRVLRDELGLAYTVSAGMADSSDAEPGVLRLYAGTGPEEADLAVQAMLAHLRSIHEGRFSDDEVLEAQEYLAGSWVFDYQTVGQRVDRLLDLERLGLPIDEPLAWPDRILRIRPAEVRQAARRQVRPEAIVRLEYGPLIGRKERTDRDCA